MSAKTALKFFNIRFVAALFTFLLVAVSAKPARCDVNAWPFLEVTDETTTVLYPFYVNEEDFRMMFPLYYNTNNGKDHHIVWPLVKISGGRLKRFAPFWFSEQEDSYTLFPFIRQTPEYTFWSIPPVYFDHDSDFFAIFPLYLKNNTRKFIFPNMYMKKGVHADGQERFVFFPVYDKINTPDEKRLWLFPYYSEKTPTGDAKAVFPFYYEGEKQIAHGQIERTVWSMWPVYGKTETFSADGSLVERKRRFLVFTDTLNRYGTRKMEIFGIPVRETFSAGMKDKNKERTLF